MTKKKNQHVLPHSKGNRKDWAVRGDNSKRNTKITVTKSEAIIKARQTAKNQKTELVIHNRDGRISDKDSYGNDPHPPRDKRR